MLHEPFIAVTNKDWFEFLSSIADQGRVDEVNFWSPSAQRPMKTMKPGEPVFFRLPKPDYCVAGYGFFAHFSLLELDLAWDTFGAKNGAADRPEFLSRLGRYRREDLEATATGAKPLACTILRDAVFLPRERWIPWGAEKGWPMNAVQGRSERDPQLIAILLDTITRDRPTEPEEFTAQFQVLDVDEREIVEAQRYKREGQGTFRSRLLDAYGRRCAISGERTEPVLDAAHVQPYLGARSNHLQNGLLLTKELHALFDRGLMTVTPDYRVRVSKQIREKWSNGRRYYEFEGRELASLPDRVAERPCADALRWHGMKSFKA